MKTKRMTCRAYLKAVNEQDRTVEQIVSVFGNVDFGKDRVNLGAFVASLDRWAASGDPIPAIWSHTWDDPFAHIGAVVDAKELAPGDPLLPEEIADLGGLYVKYRVDDKPFAGQVFDLLKERRVREASFAYDVLKERRGADGVNDLLELDLIEVGPTLKGMNPLTQLLARKNLAAVAEQAGVTVDQLKAVLGQVDPAQAKTVSHTFIPQDDDSTRCVLCGLTRSTVGHLNTLSAPADGQKANVNVAGSVEIVLNSIFDAALEWASTNNVGAGGLYDVQLEATFPAESPARAVFRVEGWDDPLGGGEYFEARFVAGDGGDLVVDGDPTPVVIEGVVSPKARRKAISRIVNSDGSPATTIKSHTVDGRDDDRRTSKGKGQAAGGGEEPEDPEAGSGSESGTGEASRALLELDLLELA
jgi:HK97 family phage prohead protease